MKKTLWLLCIIVSIMLGNNTQASTNAIATGTVDDTIAIWAYKQHLIADTDDLDHTLTRAHAAQLYLNIAKQQRGTGVIIQLMSGNTTTGCVFVDTKDHGYANIITTACKRGIFKGSSVLFRPDDVLTPLDALIILMRINYGMQDEHSTPRYQSYINLALRKNIITQSDILLINSGLNISTDQILQWTYATSHPINHDTSKGTHNQNRLAWIKWVVVVLIVRGLWRLLSRTIMGDTTMHHIIGTKPVGVYDDLTIIEGIGPKVQQILYENDILTYDSMSKLTAGHISNIISPYGTTYESMNPVTWPRQAHLAREGQRDELKIFKQELKKGM